MALTRPFCENGNKTTIPQTTSDGSVSYDQGFTYAYALPPEEGGLFIDRAQFNQLMYDTTSQVIANTAAIVTKANANATVNLSGNQTIQGVKTFSVPPVSATNPSNNNQVANKSYVDSVGNTAVKLTGNQTIQGTKTFNNNIVSPNITAMQNNLNTIFSSTTKPVKTQTFTKTITVGTGGDFADLLSAIAEARTYASRVEIRFLSDLRTTENIVIGNLNGGNIVINFNNFKIINTNPNTAYNLSLVQSCIGSINNLSLVGYTFGVLNNSNALLLNNITINNSQYETDCIRVWFGSTIATYFDTTATITLSHGGQRSSIYASIGSIIGISGDTTINDNSPDGFCLNVYRGGIINTTSVTINSTSAAIANQTANTVTRNGIIFGNYSL